MITEADITRHLPAALLPVLDCAVAMQVERLRTAPPEEIQRLSILAGQEIASNCDMVLVSQPRRRRVAMRTEVATALRWLSLGIACAAYAPGGVELFGRRWVASGRVIGHLRPEGR